MRCVGEWWFIFVWGWFALPSGVTYEQVQIWILIPNEGLNITNHETHGFHWKCSLQGQNGFILEKELTVFCIESFGIYSYNFLGVNSPNKTCLLKMTSDWWVGFWLGDMSDGCCALEVGSTSSLNKENYGYGPRTQFSSPKSEGKQVNFNNLLYLLELEKAWSRSGYW